MRYLREIFDDWLIRAAGIIFILIVGLVIFNTVSDLPEKYPLFGVFNYSLVPVLFIAGGIVFISALADVRFHPVLYHEIAVKYTNYGYVIDGDTIPPMYDGKARQEKADCWWASIPAWISHPEEG